MPGRHQTWYSFVRWLVKSVYFTARGGLTPIGLENFPKVGAVIVAPLHISHLDPPAVACAADRHLRFMAKAELFKVPILGRIIASVGAYPVRRGEGDTEAIRVTLKMLEDGEAVLVFPEGTRGDGVEMGAMNKGIVFFAKKSGALVMPVGVIGTNVVMPRGKGKGRSHPMKIVFGKPFTYREAVNGVSSADAKAAFAARLQSEILALCHENGYPIRAASSIAGQASDVAHE